MYELYNDTAHIDRTFDITLDILNGQKTSLELKFFWLGMARGVLSFAFAKGFVAPEAYDLMVETLQAWESLCWDQVFERWR